MPEARTARALIEIGRRFYARGWVMGTSGNFSTVVSTTPLRLAITASSVHKGRLKAAHVLRLDEQGRATAGRQRPSAESLIHLEIVRRRDARAVLHTHSVWSTLFSDVYGERGGVTLAGYEMLKGLDGIDTHEREVWIPIVENDQDMSRLSRRVGDILAAHPAAPAILLRRHGLYTWGKSLAEAERHVEVLEFLFETVGRTATFIAPEKSHGIPAHS